MKNYILGLKWRNGNNFSAFNFNIEIRTVLCDIFFNAKNTSPLIIFSNPFIYRVVIALSFFLLVIFFSISRIGIHWYEYKINWTFHSMWTQWQKIDVNFSYTYLRIFLDFSIFITLYNLSRCIRFCCVYAFNLL